MIKTGGAGGMMGGGPRVADNNLFSKDTVEFTLGIGEGPIAGLVQGPLSFLVGDTPLVSKAGESNFDTFNLHVYHGDDLDPTPVQNALGGIVSNQVVNVQLAKDTPVVRQTSAALRNQIDALKVRVAIQALYRADDKGNQQRNTARFELQYRQAGATNWRPFRNKGVEVTIRGKTTSTYIREFTRRVPRVNNDWEIRIVKKSPDNDNQDVVNLAWESFQLITNEDRAYEGLALVRGLAKASDQFSSIPNFSGIYAGRVVKIPSNYDPKRRFYDGPWDGEFKLGFTTNPVWIIYDLLMNTRYGVRRHYPYLETNRFSFYAAAQWCDELVPRPTGGFQPRYTYSEYINQARNALELIAYIAGIFGGVLLTDMNGSVTMKVDRPGVPVQIFGQESVTAEGFNYQFTDITERVNDIRVAFVNPDLGFEVDSRRVFDQAWIDQNGRIPDDSMVAVGCINVHEAQRRAWRKILIGNTEKLLVTFQTARPGIALEVFDLIGVSDPEMNWGLTGRVKSVQGNTIHLRDFLLTPVNSDMNLQLQTPTGVVVLTVRSSAESTKQLQIQSGTWPANAPSQAQFTLSHPSIGLTKPFRVMSIRPDSENPDLFTITALEHNVNKYFDIDNLTSSGTVEYDYEREIFAEAPTLFPLESGESTLLVQADGTLVPRIFVRVEAPRNANVREFVAFYRRVGFDEFQSHTFVGETTYLQPIEAGRDYEVYVCARTTSGVMGRPSEIRSTVAQGRTQAPRVDELVLQAEMVGANILLKLEGPLPEDYAGFEVRLGNTWSAGTRIGRTSQIELLDTEVTTPSRRYIARIRNRSGFISNSQVMVDVVVPAPEAPSSWNISQTLENLFYEGTRSEDPLFSQFRIWGNATGGGEATLLGETQEGRIVFRRTQLTGYAALSVSQVNQAGVESPRSPWSSIPPFSMDTEIRRLFEEADVSPIRIVDVLPETGELDELVWLRPENRLYRWNGTAWVTTTPGEFSWDDFPPDARPIRVVDELPATGAPDELVILRPENRIYRWNGTAWQPNAPGEVDVDSFPPHLRPIEVVDALPTNGNFAGRVVLLNTDNKIYRHTGSAWTAAVSAADIAGQIVAAQIAALEASKITGQMTNEQIAQLDAAKLTGQIKAPQIEDGAVTNAKIAGLAASKITGQLTDSQIAAVGAAKLTGQVVAAQIADAAITTAKFASGLRPVEVVSSLPTSGNTNGRTVVLTTDGKLYRYHSGAWTSAVSSSDIAGQIAAAQIAALEASKITGQLTDAQIAAVGAAKMTGQIIGTQISDNAITSPKIATGAVTANEVAANAIIADKIASNAVTAVKIQAGAVEAAKIAAGAVETEKLAAGAVVADKIAAGAITADKIAANAITAGKIAAGAITASEIAAGAITASKLAIIPTTNLLQNGGFELDAVGGPEDPNTYLTAGTPVTFTDTNDSSNGGTSPARTGRACRIRIASGQINANVRVQFPRVEVEPGKRYRLAAWIRRWASTSIPEGNHQLRINWIDGNGSYISAAAPAWANANLPGDFVQRVAEGEAPEGAAYADCFFVPMTSTETIGSTARNWFIDDVTFRDMVSAELIVDGAITSDKIVANAITAAKIASDAVTADKIVANAVTAVKINAGAVEAAKIAAGAVIADKIAAGAVVAGKIAANAVTATEIAAGTITASEIASNAITTAKIAASAVTAGEIATNAVTAVKIQAGAVEAAKIAAGAVVAGKIAAEAVTAGTIAANVVTAVEIATNTITAAQIASGTITANEIASRTITANRIVAGAITATEIAAGTITGDRIAAGTITGNRIAGNTITATQIAANTITANEIATNSITADRLNVGTVRAALVAAHALLAENIAAGAITARHMTIGGTDNIVLNPELDDFDGWDVDSQVEGPVNAPTNMSSRRTARFPVTITSNRYIRWPTTVEAGREYLAVAEIRAEGSTPWAQFRHYIQWYDRAGANFANSAGPTVLRTNTTPIISTYSAKAPAGAVRARFIMGRLNNDSNSGNLHVGSPAVRVMGDGALIVDGSIQARHINVQDLLASNAFIQNLNVTNANISGVLQSDDFVAGSTGWRIAKNGGPGNRGIAEFNSLIVRESLVVGSVSEIVNYAALGEARRINTSWNTAATRSLGPTAAGEVWTVVWNANLRTLWDGEGTKGASVARAEVIIDRRVLKDGSWSGYTQAAYISSGSTVSGWEEHSGFELFAGVYDDVQYRYRWRSTRGTADDGNNFRNRSFLARKIER